jgi:hypothetical protein
MNIFLVDHKVQSYVRDSETLPSKPNFTSSTERLLLMASKNIGILVFRDPYGPEPKLLLLRETNARPFLAPLSRRLGEQETLERAARAELFLKAGLPESTIRYIVRVLIPGFRGGLANLQSWDLYCFNADDNAIDALEKRTAASWYTRGDLEKLAARTVAREAGQISDAEWERNPGFDDQWYNLFQYTGFLEDPTQSQRYRLQSYYYGRTPITGRYYGKEYEQTQAAARALAAIGIPTYPKANPDTTQVTNKSGEVFNFLGGNQLVDPPYQVQLGFFRTMKRTNDIPMVNSFCYVAIQEGYLGRTASIEVAYAMANSKRLIFSEAPTKFSIEAPAEVVSIINLNYRIYPTVSIDEIPNRLVEARKQQIRSPVVTQTQRDVIYLAITNLIRDLRLQFGSNV